MQWCLKILSGIVNRVYPDQYTEISYIKLIKEIGQVEEAAHDISTSLPYE